MAWTEADIPDQSGRVAIVTGANSGIGLHTARALAERGATVVLACRNTSKGEAAETFIRSTAKEAALELEELDLADLNSVRAFVERLSHPGVDLLINNAGVMMTPKQQTKDGFELQFGTNHLGHFALTGLLIDRLVDGGRVVNVSSNAHKAGRIDFDDLDSSRSYSKVAAYCRSKLANLLFSRELQRRLQAAGRDVRVASAHPGWAATNLMDGVLGFFTGLLAQDAAMGAAPTLYAAVAEDVVENGYYGPRWFDMVGPPVPSRVFRNGRNDAVAARLWEVSQELTGVSYL